MCGRIVWFHQPCIVCRREVVKTSEPKMQNDNWKLVLNLTVALTGIFAGSVCLAQSPSNDHFTNAISLYGNSVAFTGTLANATFEAAENPCPLGVMCPFPGSVWFLWTATNSTTVLILPEAHTSHDAGFSVHTGSSLAALADLDGNRLDSWTNRSACFLATAGTTYFIRVAGDGAAFTLRLTTTNSPVILSSPQDQTIPESASAFFSVFAAGVRPLSYQWQYEGKNLAGETAACLELHYVAASRAGDYSVVVSNVSGVVTSAVAQLTVSPTAPDVILNALESPDPARFRFSITGEAGRKYRVWSSTNLVQWWDEEEFRVYPWDIWSQSVVQNTNATSAYSIPKTPAQKFLRIMRYMDTEICIAHLREIDFAIKLWAIENKKESTASILETDIMPYFKQTGIYVCPSRGTTFADSYTLGTAGQRPTCQKNYLLHKLQ